LDYLSIPTPVKFSGRSLKPIIEGNETAEGRGLIERQYISTDFSERYGVERTNLLGIRRWPYKFIMDDGNDVELFNLETDPREQKNIAEDFPELTESLKAETLGRMKLIQQFQAPGMDSETVDTLKTLGYL